MVLDGGNALSDPRPLVHPMIFESCVRLLTDTEFVSEKFSEIFPKFVNGWDCLQDGGRGPVHGAGGPSSLKDVHSGLYDELDILL